MVWVTDSAMKYTAVNKQINENSFLIKGKDKCFLTFSISNFHFPCIFEPPMGNFCIPLRSPTIDVDTTSGPYLSPHYWTRTPGECRTQTCRHSLWMQTNYLAWRKETIAVKCKWKVNLKWMLEKLCASTDSRWSE